MIDGMDAYLGRVLKNWTALRNPPGNSRARLLWMAAHPPSQGKAKNGRQQMVIAYDYRPADWSHTLLSWAIVYTFQDGLSNSRLLV